MNEIEFRAGFIKSFKSLVFLIFAFKTVRILHILLKNVLPPFSEPKSKQGASSSQGTFYLYSLLSCFMLWLHFDSEYGSSTSSETSVTFSLLLRSHPKKKLLYIITAKRTSDLPDLPCFLKCTRLHQFKSWAFIVNNIFITYVT
jgi:hypothetical protein